jgi:hypothetical protein
VLGRDDHGYRDILGSDTVDHDARHPIGAHVAYTVELTDEEAARFAAASNCRYVEEDVVIPPARAVGRPTGTAEIPTLSTLAWLRSRYVDLRKWHGRDVRVAVLDQGTTQAVRDVMGFTLVARAVHSGINLGGRELFSPEHEHGCLVAPNAVPAGGLLLDGIISDETGGAPNSAIATGITWAVDNGAKVVNCSFSSPPGGTTAQAILDACTYANTNGGVQIVFAAGNDNTADIGTPAAASRTNVNVYSSIAFDEATDRRALFSNHAADASGCAPGVDVTSLDIYGKPVRWNGTSASAPHTAQMMARALTGAQFTPAQVGAAIKNNTRDTGAGAAEQGGGGVDLHRALVALGGEPATASAAGVGVATIVDTRGGTGDVTGWTLATPTTAQPDDVRIVFLASGAYSDLVTPQGWQVLDDSAYYAGYELNAGQSVIPIRLRVLAKALTADEPDPATIGFGDGRYSAIGAITVRGVGGLDPQRFVPTTRFGTGASVSAVPVLPATTNDLLICAFALRTATASTATLPLPSGLAQRGFWRPTTAGAGFALLVATATLPSAARSTGYVSTSNDATGTWASAALTVPCAPAALATVTQSEPAGPAGAFLPFLPAA